MYDFLTDQALKYIWCTPNQDKQAIVKPARLTPAGGSWNKVQVLWDSISLPVQAKRFHVYMVGQLHPMLMGLFPSFMQWKTIASNCNEQTMICDIYDISGLQYPRVRTWYMVTKNRNLIVAVQQPEVNTIPVDFDEAEIYFRVYSNEYFNSHRSSPLDDYIKVNGKLILNAQDILDLQTEFIAQQALPGFTYAFVNGFTVNEISPLTCSVGDLVEYVYDSSIKAVYDFNIADLNTFVSYLDDERKYLLHYEGNTDMIDYQDDIDLFLIKKDSPNRFKGVYHHKNQESTMRMLTHKDYSISVDMVNSFALYRPEWTDVMDLTVRLHIRHSGYQRPLMFVSNRIHELYKLSDDNIMRSFLGIDSNVEVFQAENLEASAYTAIMRSDTSCISKPLVEEAFGFNSISRQLAYTPQFVRIESSQKVIDVPYGLTSGSTGYEYDADGLLLSWHDHVGGTIYSVRNTETELVEMITGQTGRQLEEYYNESTTTLTPGVDYRFYTCPILNGQPTNQWVDVTDSAQYAILNNEVTWFTNPSTTYTLIRGNSKNLGYSIDLPVSNGLLKFSLTHEVFREGQTTNQVMQISMGYLDLFLNDKSLIEDLDYFVQFPEIVIVNKEYLIDPENQDQKITVRFSNHCLSDLTRDKRWDMGFIDHALLSNNNRFDIRDDKVLRLTVDGALYDRSEFEYAEEDSGVSVPDARNGSPYLIRDIIPALKGYTEASADDLREVSLAIDKEVSDYMSIKIPPPEITNPNAILNHYQIYSPFVSKILFDLIDGIIDDPRIKDHYNDQDAMDIVKDYEYLLAFDPTQPANEVDDKYVRIHPHYSLNMVDVNIYQFKFIDRIIKIYCNEKVVSISHYLRVVGYGV